MGIGYEPAKNGDKMYQNVTRSEKTKTVDSVDFEETRKHTQRNTFMRSQVYHSVAFVHMMGDIYHKGERQYCNTSSPGVDSGCFCFMLMN